MRIVNIIGGLGNQMFQYALMVGLRDAYHEEIYADCSGFSHYHLHNGLELERIFPIELKRAGGKSRWFKSHLLSCYINQFLPFLTKGYKFEYPDLRFVEDIYTAQYSDCYYMGYWHHYKYVENIRTQLLREYRFKKELNDRNSDVMKSMLREDSVGIHVRRGDYLKEKQYQGICDIDYYTRAISIFKEKFKAPVFYVFSNDMRWCEDNLGNLMGDSRVVYVDWNKGEDSYCDMQLMTFCKGLIIANSSFSWWGAFLNNREDRVVVSPKKWLNKKHSPDIQMPEWIKI